MTNYKQLCAELLAALEEEASNWNLDPECHPLVVRARAMLAEPTDEENPRCSDSDQAWAVSYEFSVLNDDYCTEASGTAPTLELAIDEGRHYLAQYSQDGNYTLQVRRIETIPVHPLSTDTPQASLGVV